MAPADQGDEVGHAPAVDVEHRHDVEHHVVLVEAEGDLGVERVEVQRPLAERNALGEARRPARVEQLRDGVLVDLRLARLPGAAGEQGLVLVGGDPATLALHDHEPGARRQLRDDRLDKRREVPVEEDHPRARVLQDVGDLVRRKADVDRVQDGARLEHPVVALEQVVGVGGDERDAIAWPHPAVHQGVGELMRSPGPRAVGQGSVAVDDADLVPEVRRRAVTELEHGQGNEHGDLLVRWSLPLRAVSRSADRGASGTASGTSAGRPSRTLPRHHGVAMLNQNSKVSSSPRKSITAAASPVIADRAGRA